ncbi:MAG: hypothetical protein QOH95_870, partial [Gaiellaceae bacterium]|nr:hypothetical protein [Gaiellaceae bacterium]
TAFFNDPTIQGYGCGGITPPVTPKPGTPTPQGGTSPVQVTPQAAQPVVVIAAVKGTRHTVTPTKTPVAGVQGAQHTVKAPVRASAAAPLATTKATGTLPFTGAQLALFALVGLALVAAGTLLRSTAKQPPRS